MKIRISTEVNIVKFSKILHLPLVFQDKILDQEKHVWREFLFLRQGLAILARLAWN